MLRLACLLPLVGVAADSTCSASFNVLEDTSTPNATIYKDAVVSSADDCCSLCNADGSACDIWLYEPKDNKCKLKQGKNPDLRTGTGKTTGIRTAPAPPAPPPPPMCSADFEIWKDVSCPDLEIIKTADATDDSECCALCSAEGSACEVWLYQDGECKLKKAGPQGWQMDGLHSKKGKFTGVRKSTAPLPPRPPAPSKRPNFIVVLTDDQDVRLGSMAGMPYTMEHIARGGANMSNFFVNTPICCPSRSTLLSGRQNHNNKALTEADAWSTSGGLKLMCMHMNVSQTLNPQWWKDSFIHRLYFQHGYATGIFGKLLNQMDSYGCNEGSRVPGVDRLFAMCGISYDNTRWADQGGPDSPPSGLNHTGRNPEDYSTSLLANASLAWIRSVVESGPDHRPFFAWLGPHSPHLPATPAEWYKDHPVGETALPKEVYYNHPGTDKHSFISSNPAIDAAAEAAIQIEHGNRLRTLLSVDDAIKGVRDYLVEVGEWDNTYLIFTSDHGYSLGQFRIESHKEQVYDHNTRIPMLIAGPGIIPGSDIAIPASMTDIAPTILELANGGALPEAEAAGMDGTSFAQQLLGNSDGESWPKDAVLIEYQSIHLNNAGETVPCLGPDQTQTYYHDGPNNTYSALRIISKTEDLLYAEFADVTNPDAWRFSPETINFYELYNVSEDFFMLNNIYESAPEALKTSLHERLHVAIGCSGESSCRKVLSGEDVVLAV